MLFRSILRFGRQLHKIIMSAIDGEDAADLGARIFDLSPKGCSLKIKVEKQGDYPTYVSSKFALPKEIENLEEKDFKTIYNGTFDLEKYVSAKSYEDIQNILAQHYHCSEDVEESRNTSEEAVSVVTKVATPKLSEVKAKAESKAADADEALSELLKDL